MICSYTFYYHVGNPENLVAVLLGASIPVTFALTVPFTSIVTCVGLYLACMIRKTWTRGISKEDQEENYERSTQPNDTEGPDEIKMQACPAYDTFVPVDTENTIEYI